MTTKELANGLHYFNEELTDSVSEFVKNVEAVKSGDLDCSINELFQDFYNIQSVVERIEKDFDEAMGY
tara:strand:- start:111 stop:314 length:204 start_codon:yes stop_codon:yes gene_type:complete